MNMRWILLLALGLSACADPHALTYVSSNAPIWNINPSMWTGNDLTTAPTLPINTAPGK
jgi:hypothetical protein